MLEISEYRWNLLVAKQNTFLDQDKKLISILRIGCGSFMGFTLFTWCYLAIGSDILDEL